MTNTWWKIEVQATTETPSDEAAFLVHDIGAAGSNENPDGSITAYFRCTEDEISSAKEQIESLALLASTPESVEDQNWHANCAELWQPTQIKNLILTPVLTPEERGAINKENIYIIPGTGFGTGHHPSTQMAIQLLQHDSFKDSEITQVLDFGTGSGVLTVACALLNPDAEIVAIDNDPEAIINTRENLTMNELKRARVECGSIECAGDSYDLIMANIYLQLVATYGPALHKKLNKNAKMILSGLRERDEKELRGIITEKQWIQLERLQEGEWISFLLQKR